MMDEDDSSSSVPALVARGDSSSCYDSDSSDEDSSTTSMPRLITRAQAEEMNAREEHQSGRETPASLPDLASDSSIPDLIEYDFHRLLQRRLAFHDVPEMNFQNVLIEAFYDARNLRMSYFDDSTYSASSIETDFDVEVEPLLDYSHLEFRKMVIHMMIENGFGGNVNEPIDDLKKDSNKTQHDSFEVAVKTWKGREALLETLKDTLTKNRVRNNEILKEKRENDIIKFATCYEEAIEEIDGLEGDSDSFDSIHDDEEEDSNMDDEVDSENDELISSEDTSSSCYSSDDDSINSMPSLLGYIPGENRQHCQTSMHRDRPIIMPTLTSKNAKEIMNEIDLIQIDMEHVLEKISILQKQQVYIKDVKEQKAISLPELNTANDTCFCKMVSQNVLSWILAGKVKERIGLLIEKLLHLKIELDTQNEQQNESQVFVAEELVQDLTSFARFLDGDVLENRMIFISTGDTRISTDMIKTYNQ